MKIAVTTDHAGFQALQELKAYLQSLGYEMVDYGPDSLNPEDDYPDYIFPAARAVGSGECQRAIILGGSGQGEAMAANRVSGVRCTVFYGPAVAKAPVDIEGDIDDDPYEIIKLSREHNDANILSLAGRFLSVEEMKAAVEVWLATDFSGLERHARRNRKLDEAS